MTFPSFNLTPVTSERTRLSRSRSLGYYAAYYQYHQACVSHQQWAAMYQQMCTNAANAMAQQPGQAPAPQQLQRMGSYPYGGWSPAASVPQKQPTQQLQRAASAPTPVAQPAGPQQPAVPQVVPQPVQQPAEQPAAPQQPPVLENAAPAQPRRGFGNLFQPAVAFRLFMFYYLFCSPTLPEWQRQMFVGALVLFYFYSVDLIGYLCPGRRRRNAAANADLDVIPLGPNDDEANNEPRAPPRPLSKRVLVERFVVGLFASLLPSWNPATMN